MAANQRNYQMFDYVDDNGNTFAKRGVLDAAINAVDGSSALTGAATSVWIDTPRKRTRKAVFVDPTTFRTVKFTVYTAAAFAALTSASTLAISVPGETGTVTYSLAQKIGEKQPTPKATRQLPDHA